jgi:hypothetical protein
MKNVDIRKDGVLKYLGGVNVIVVVMKKNFVVLKIAVLVFHAAKKGFLNG